MKPLVGIVGWRGMVGSVLVARMLAERYFARIEARFFSTSQAGGVAPAIGRSVPPLADANDLEALKAHDILVSCQGSDFTLELHATHAGRTRLKPRPFSAPARGCRAASDGLLRRLRARPGRRPPSPGF